MKKFGFLFPIALFLLFTLVGNKVLATRSMSPSSTLIVAGILLIVLLMFRPKKAAARPVDDFEVKIRGDFAKEAFADKPQLAAKFHAAMKDYGANCPKACLSKLTKLAPQCTTDQETYAVAMATGLTQVTLQNFKAAIREYNRAIVLNPTAETAISIGSCQQRLGELDKAIDSYEFALDLEPGNLDALCRLATANVANGNYDTALEQAQLALEREETNASALATAAICYGMLDEPLLRKRYTELAVENGYKASKIDDTITALKKNK